MNRLPSVCFLFVFLAGVIQGCATPGEGWLVSHSLIETLGPDARSKSGFPYIWLVQQLSNGRLGWFSGYPPELREVRSYLIHKEFREDLEKFRQDRKSIGALALRQDEAWIEWWDGRERHIEFQLYSGDPFYFVKATKNADECFYQVPRPWPKSDQRSELHWRLDWQDGRKIMMAYSEQSGDWKSPRIIWNPLHDRRNLACLPMDKLGTDYVPIFADVIRRLPPNWKIEHTMQHGENGQERESLPQVYVSRRSWFTKSTTSNGLKSYHQIHPSYTRSLGY